MIYQDIYIALTIKGIPKILQFYIHSDDEYMYSVIKMLAYELSKSSHIRDGIRFIANGLLLQNAKEPIMLSDINMIGAYAKSPEYKDNPFQEISQKEYEEIEYIFAGEFSPDLCLY